ncbi:hypothetical protein D0Z00_004334 [Geotrichum galactomycetum]|uniref:Uncharacterized protein n=1 Tax=Geotrichum galactomycetum TaxID=27317 RepID=A0ACB6UYP5_9ASCO|nr:hypothetical protein D0Z00_004334 [Geotrichum candidum]
MNTLYTSRETLADLAAITTKAAEISHTLASAHLTNTESESKVNTRDSKNSISVSVGGRIPSLSAIMTEQQLLTSRERRLLSLYDQVESLTLAARTLEEIPNIVQQTRSDNESNVSAPRVVYTVNPQLVDAAAEATLADTLRDKVRLLEHRYKLKRAIAEEIIMGLPVSDAVYGTEETAKEGAEVGLDGRMAVILPLLALRDDLESQVLKLYAECESKNNSFPDPGSKNDKLSKGDLDLDLQAQAIQAHARNRQALSTLDTELSSQYDRILARLTPADRAELVALLGDLRTSRTKAAILADLIPMLITGSGVDWTENEQLSEILLECGQIGLNLNEEIELDDVIFAT